VRGLEYHLVVYLAVNALVVASWALFSPSGSFDQVSQLLTHPDQARSAGFYPIYLILFWGVGLLAHALIVLLGAPARRRRRRRERRKRQAERREAQRAARHAAAHDVPPPAWDASDLPRQRQWVAVMFTDIVDSTPLTERLGDARWSELLAEHRATVRETVTAHDGREVGTQGDSFFVRFDEPDDAADCAAHLQQLLAKHRLESALVPHIRVGLHAGDVMRHDDDLVGRVINLAARVVAVADEDEILLTEPMADHLSRSHLLVDHGLRTLKGFEQPRHLLALRWDLEESDPTAPAG
jgi:class 3 adenylate cyclase